MENMYDILAKLNSVTKTNLTEGKRPDFLDLDKDGDKKEPMAQAARQAKIKEDDKTAARDANINIDHGVVPMSEADMEEGNDFTGARMAAIKAGKPTFSVDGKTYRVTGDTSDEKVMEKTVWPGTKEYKAKYPDDMRTGEKRRSSTGGEIERTATGVKHTAKAYDDEEETAAADDSAPKKKGRPKGSKRALGAKGPTGKSKLMQKGSIKEAELEEDYDQDEYDEEGEMAKSQSRTIADAARELQMMLGDDENLPEWVQKKITLAQAYIDSARDYLAANRPDDEMAMAEVAPPGAKAERMVKHIKKGYAKDGKLTPKEKSIAYATAWKAHKAGKVEEESTETRDERAEKAGRRVAKDIEYDEKVKDKIHGKKRGSEDDKAERAGRKVTKDIEHDEKVDETTVAGSVATAPAAKGKKGMIFGKGVYEGAIAESFEKKLSTVLTEGMSINASQGEDGSKSLTVTATDDDAVKLAHILQLAGMQQGHDYAEVCPTCGKGECGCEEELEEAELANSPDEQTFDTETMVNDLSGGLNARKTTGQSTEAPPNLDRARQSKAYQAQMAESKEQSLWELYQRYETRK